MTHRLPRRAAAIAAAVGLGGAALAGGIALAAPDDPDSSAALATAINPAKPKNVILLVGDGMGDAEVTLGRYYTKGADGHLNMDTLPFRGAIGTYVLSPGTAPYAPNYTPDSAPTATSWSTGKKTIDGRLSQGPSAAANIPGDNAGFVTTMEVAKQRGLRTGNVSTAEITDATPAAPSSHISQRACQGPADTRTICPSETKEAGGLGSIAEQQVDLGADVVLGGGRDRYEQPLAAGGTETVVDYAKTKGYSYVTDSTGLDGFGTLSGGKKVLGLFNAGNMTTEFAPLPATDTGAGSPTTRCVETNRPANEPSLPAMTSKAIGLLDADNPKGFFLQVEGASIDKRDHAADACGQIGETLAFDNAVGVALDFQKAHPDTLVVVTADHSHTSQIIGPATTPRGAWVTLQTKDGAPIRVAYGTAPVTGSQSHTGAEVPVMAVGPQAANVQGYNDQTDLYSTLIGRTPSTLPAGPSTTVTTPPVTVTTPPVTVTVPSPAPPVAKPRVGVAVGVASQSALRSGLRIVAGSVGATKVSFRLSRSGKTLASKSVTVRSGFAAATLKVASARRGQKLTLTVKATGAGGTKTLTRSVTVR